jgi:bifunctional UDP-N-acetylglucosamine pyrophosphorylase/glucosamine-1-phosphate N-acetyltransferase
MSLLATVILAAGKGKRMHSDLPKVLHQMGGQSLIEHLLDTTGELPSEHTIVVVGHQADRVRSRLAGRGVTFVEQTEQLGTGHAVSECRGALSGFAGTLLVLVGDAPLLRTATLEHLLSVHAETGAACTLLTTRLEDPTGYGRIVRGPRGDVQAIVEHKDASPEDLAIDEINSGIIAFETGPLWQHIEQLSRRNVQGEYYLTDLVGIFVAAGLTVSAHCVSDPWEVAGVNSREQLAELERIYGERRAPSAESD